MKRRAFLAAAAGAFAGPVLRSRRAGAAGLNPGSDTPPRTRFVHLGVRSWYSRDGVASPERIVQKAKELGFRAVALTDEGTLFGILDFHEAAKAAGIKPVLGCELRVDGTPAEMQSRRQRRRSVDRLTVLASDATGYKNLLALVSMSLTNARREPSGIALDGLASHAAGLIAISGCAGSQPSRLLTHGKSARAQEIATRYQDVFGPQNFFLAVCPDDLRRDIGMLAARVALGRSIGAPVVAMDSVRYLEPEEMLAHQVLTRRRRRGAVTAHVRASVVPNGVNMRSSDEMAAIFSAIPEACRNTVLIAERCDVALPLGVPRPPWCAVPAGQTVETYLERLAFDGLRDRYRAGAPADASDRLAHELGVVTRLGLAGQVLSLRDLLEDAQTAGIPLAMSPHAALGSLLLYCVGVTPIDPLRFGLLFERFLDGCEAARIDVSLDFPHARRSTVLRTLAARHGDNRVVTLTNVCRLGSWAALQWVGQALAQESDIDTIMSLVADSRFGVTLDEAVRQSCPLRERLQSDARLARLYDAARALEGRPVRAYRSTPVILLSAASPEMYVPVYRTARLPEAVLGCEHRHVDKLGYALDLVGVPGRQWPEKALARIPQSRKLTLDVESIPLDDDATYAFLSRGRSSRIPGLESRLLHRALRALRPENFDELTALLALCRPGANHLLPELIERKHERVRIPPAHPIVERITRETFGLIVYQEQVMRVVSELAGFTAAEAERFRKALGTRPREAVLTYRERFLSGCASQDVPGADTRATWILLEPSRHIILKAYVLPEALLAYRVAYVRAHSARDYVARRGDHAHGTATT